MVTMTAMEPLQRLFFRANDMVQEVSDSFEQHFLWLEEVVAEARQTLTSADLHLLPKTPSAAPRRTRRVVQEDGENLAPATSQTARRGRLCSKLALEKIQEQGRISKIKKLRRPSSTIPQVLPSTTHKRTHFEVSPSHSGSEEEPGESPRPKCETVIPTSPRSSFGSFQQNTKSVLLPREPSRTPQKDASPQKTYPTSPQKNDSPSQEAPPISTQKGDNSPQNDDLATPVKKVTSCEKERKKSQRDNICQDQNSPQAISSSPSIDLISPCRKSSPKKVVSESPGPSTRLKKSSISENISNQKNISEKAPQEEDMGDSSQDTTKATVVPQAPPHEEEEFHLQLDESHDEDSEEEQDIEMVCELPKNAITQGSTPSNEISSTEQIKEDVISLSSLTQTSSIDNGEVSCTNSEAIEVKNVSSSSSTVPTSYSLPAPRITHSTQKAIESLDTPCSSDILPQSPSVPAPRVTRTKQKATKVQDIPSLSEGLPQPAVAPAPRITRTKQKAIEAQVLLPPESIPQPPSAPAPRVTRTKQKAIEKEMAPSSPILPQPAPRVTRTKQKAKEMEPPPSPQEPSYKKGGSADEEEETNPRNTQVKLVHHQHMQGSGDKNLKGKDVKDSGVFSLGVRVDGWGSAESVSSGDSYASATQHSTPPMRVTRSKMSKLQPAQPSLEKALPATQDFQRNCCSPRGTVLPHSPCRESPSTRRLAVHSDRDGGMDHLTSEVLHSPVRIVRHSPDKIGKVVVPRLAVMFGNSGRVTPSLASKMQLLGPNSHSSSSSSASTDHRRIIKRTAGTPLDSRRRPANIVTGITSFIKSRPILPTREEIEEVRLQELQRKKEHEEDIVKKKEQLLWAKTEERKRLNEERMRRAKEARLKRDQMAAEAKEQQKRERQQKEARQREEEEQQRQVRQQQLAKRKAEEEAKKAAKLKEEEEKSKQEEEEKKRKKLEEEKRRQKQEEENRKKLEEERRNYLAEQRNVLEKQRKLKMGKTMLVKEKEEAEQFRVKESLRILREKELQAKREQEAKAVMSSTYLNKEKAITNEASSGHLNTTYTKPEATNVKTDSYEMTPAQPQRSSLSLNNYDIDDMQSDDSTDDDVSPKKKIPQWAMKTQMRAALLQQEHYPPKMDNIFPPTSVLVLPDLSQIFPKQKRRFRKRTSSAIWETPPSKFFRVVSPKVM